LRPTTATDTLKPFALQAAMVSWAIVSAMAADRSLRASSCALAGATNVQARPIPARRYNATDIVQSSLDPCRQDRSVARRSTGEA
jgi:hypothetical protein